MGLFARAFGGLATALFLQALVCYDRTQSLPHNVVVLYIRANSFLHGELWAHADLNTSSARVALIRARRTGLEATAATIATSPWLCSFAFAKDVCEVARQDDMKELELELPSRDPGRTIPATCILPSEGRARAAKPALGIHFHGGGLVLGSVSYEMTLSRYFAAALDVVICSVEYRLAPENTFPAAIHDGLDASVALITQSLPALEGLYNSSRTALFGVSAGGYMAAQTALHLAEAGVRATIQVLIVPMAKPFGGTRSMITNANSPMWSMAANMWAWTMYLAGDNGTECHSWRTNLLQAPDHLLSLAPPAYVVLATHDTLRDEGDMYAQRLQAVDKLLALDEYPTSHFGVVMAGFNEQVLSKALAVLSKVLKE